MGFLDKAKKLAEQAKDKAGQAKDLANQARDLAQQTLDDVRGQATGSGSGGSPPAPTGTAPGRPAASRPAGAGDAQFGTPYVAGMLGRPGWRERGLPDPAAVLPIKDRDQAGVPHSTKSKIVEEPYGMGRRWAATTGSAGLFYQLYPEHYAWEPPGGKTAFAEVSGASAATLPDGRTLVFLAANARAVVLEVNGLPEGARAGLARVVATQLSS